MTSEFSHPIETVENERESHCYCDACPKTNGPRSVTLRLKEKRVEPRAEFRRSVTLSLHRQELDVSVPGACRGTSIVSIGQQPVAGDSSRRFVKDPLIVLADIATQALPLTRIAGKT